jgi:Fic family protein
MSYNWQQEDWPHFRYVPHAIREEEIAFAENAGQVHGMLTALPEDPRMQSVIDMMVVEALKTSAIEGEVLSRRDVWSSIRNNLGLNPIPEKILDRKAAGVARLMVVVRESFSETLTQETLFSWHKMLME